MGFRYLLLLSVWCLIPSPFLYQLLLQRVGVLFSRGKFGLRPNDSVKAKWIGLPKHLSSRLRNFPVLWVRGCSEGDEPVGLPSDFLHNLLTLQEKQCSPGERLGRLVQWCLPFHA